MRGEPGSLIISSVLEVWATHETHDDKRQYCLNQGYSFAEFHADHVLEAHTNALVGRISSVKWTGVQLVALHLGVIVFAPFQI